MMKYSLGLFFIIVICLSFSRAHSAHNCPFPYRAHAQEDKCGYIEVPGNRNNTKGQKIKIAYLVIKSKSQNPKPDPVVFLQGGPGGTVLPRADRYGSIAIDPDRDFILYDQRGTGFSNPICSDLSVKLLEVLALDLTTDKEFSELSQHLNLCKEDLRNEGIDPRGFSSIENAHDLEELRKHLGYDKWNLYGGSYGSRLALTYIKLFPARVRSSTLMAIFPPQVRLYDDLMTNFDRSLTKVFDSCEGDASCNRKYPNLRSTFFELTQSLAEDPLIFDWRGTSFTLNAQDMLLFIHQMLYDRSTIAQIPSFIMAVRAGHHSILSNAADLLAQRLQLINPAVYWSVMAGDQGDDRNTERIKTDLERNSDYGSGVAIFVSDSEIISEWSSEPYNKTRSEPVVSDIPILLVSGDFDPITPPSNAQVASRTLSNAYVVTFQNHGHTPFGSCFFAIALEFLNNPLSAPHTRCANNAGLIDWR